MAKITSILLSNLKSYKLRHHLPPLTIPLPPTPPNQSHFSRLFSSPTTPYRNTKVNFSPSDSESDDDSQSTPTPAVKEPPPPYDLFNKTPVITQPDDPTNLQEVFHKIRTEGLNNSAVKMFDELSKQGLTHEALELNMKRSALAGSGDEKLLGEAKRLFVEMMWKGLGLNAGTCVAVLEGLVKVGKEEEGREVVVKIRALGLAPDEEGLRELLKNKRGPVFRSVMNILFRN
ncbi:hypothetical protein L1987_20219 [Smallanthus sonchifolius]|uniref:Uncharacterized protein n=1 Tax=Smallanthus sonchifolius TaxID=185202 RepID=A0ACB9ISF5_9ASTR|nr:hypothetical protein L1987_20219 [Smallanthus sonchifolius]